MGLDVDLGVELGMKDDLSRAMDQGWECGSVVERLSSMHEALGSIPGTTK